MSLFYQFLLVLGITLLFLGYFQYRRKPDLISIVQEMAHPQYWLSALAVAIMYVILRIVIGLLSGIL